MSEKPWRDRQWHHAGLVFRDFDLDGRVKSWEADSSSSSTLLRNDLDFDAAGRVRELTDPANAGLHAIYQYDPLDRLNVVQKGSPVAATLQYGYDGVGNRQTFQLDSATTTSTYDLASNHLQTMSGAVDALYMLGAESVTFTYNNANRLAQIQADGTTVATYLVNALGQRVQKTVSGATIQFVYDEAGHLLGEYDGSGQLIQETVWMEDLPVATLRPTGTGTPTPIALYYVHADHLATPRAITRPSDNALMWRWDNSDPFGNNSPNDNPAGQGAFKYNLRFPGQYFDAEIGTHYNYFRDYDPSIGRYVESDPIGLAGGLSTYAYVKDRPLQWRDPNGLEAVLPGGGAALPGWLGDALGAAGQACKRFPIIIMATMSNPGDSCSDDPRRERKECRAKDDYWDKERCKKVHEECIALCSTSPPLGQGGRASQGMPFFQCVNKCMADAGCPTT